MATRQGGGRRPTKLGNKSIDLLVMCTEETPQFTLNQLNSGPHGPLRTPADRRSRRNKCVSRRNVFYSGEVVTYRAAFLGAPLLVLPVRLTGTAWGEERPAPAQLGPVRTGRCFGGRLYVIRGARSGQSERTHDTVSDLE